jgi:hypothetical protein
VIRWPARDESGLASVQAAVGLAIAVVVLMFAANLVAMHFTRGVLQAAAHAGARAGALADGTSELCELRAETMLRGESGLLRGPYGSDARISCLMLGDTVRASGRATVAWWIDVLPPVELQVAAEAAIESTPDAERVGSHRWNGSLPSD